MNKPKYLYRAIFKDLLDAYKNNPDSIPELEGKNFKQFKDLNPFPYEDDVRYMHFFDTRHPAKQYAENLEEEVGKETCVVMFEFDEKTMAECLTRGKFRVGKRNFKTFNEYIVPVSRYNPQQNFVGVLEKDAEEKQPNVYAVLHDDEIEFYATDLSRADGLEYLNEPEVARLVPKGCKERAVHFYSSKDDAMKIMSQSDGFDFDHAVVPFMVDPRVLDQFEFSVPGSKNPHYLVPIADLTEENYVEQGKAPKQQVSYDPDDYSEYKWF